MVAMTPAENGRNGDRTAHAEWISGSSYTKQSSCAGGDGYERPEHEIGLHPRRVQS